MKVVEPQYKRTTSRLFYASKPRPPSFECVLPKSVEKQPLIPDQQRLQKNEVLNIFVGSFKAVLEARHTRQSKKPIWAALSALSGRLTPGVREEGA